MIYATEALVKMKQVFKDNGYDIKNSRTNANQALLVVSKEDLELRLGFAVKDQQFKLITSEGNFSYDSMGDFEFHVKKYTWLHNVFLKQARPIALKFSQILGVSIIYDNMKSTKSTAFAYFRVLGDTTRSIHVIKKVDNDYFIVRLLQGNEPKVEVRYSSDGDLIYNENTYHFLLEQTYGSSEDINIKHIGGTEYVYEYDGFSFKSSTVFTDNRLLTYDITEINGKAETMSLTVSNLDIPALIKSIKEHLEMKIESMNVQKLDFLDNTEESKEEMPTFDDVLPTEEPTSDSEPALDVEVDIPTEEPSFDDVDDISDFDLASFVEPELSKGIEGIEETEEPARVLKEAVALTYEGVVKCVRFIYSDDEFYDIPVDQLSEFPYDMLEHSLEYKSVKGMLLTETEIEHKRFAKRYTGDLQNLIDDFWRI